MMNVSDYTQPDHYKGDGRVTCYDAQRSMTSRAGELEWMTHHESTLWECSLKYIWRFPWKNCLQDLDKAIQTLTDLKSEIMINIYSRGVVPEQHKDEFEFMPLQSDCEVENE